MKKLMVVKFGGSVIGIDGQGIPNLINRINSLKKDAKIIAVFSAPLTTRDSKKISLTDVVIKLGSLSEKGNEVNFELVNNTYNKILEFVSKEYKEDCKKTIESCLEKSKRALEETKKKGEFANEIRSESLAFSGEILMSHIMSYILKSNGIKCVSVGFGIWPIITDNNIESTNFLFSESSQKTEPLEKMIEENEVVTIGGFIGKTITGIHTTYERGGSDRTAVDLGILFHKKYETVIDFEKDNSVVSADPKIISEGLDEVKRLSYNEARLAGMFGMKILDPIAIKEILENGVEMPIIISDIRNPQKTTTIERKPVNENGNPMKIVTGKKNCAILRIESSSAQKLLESLEVDKRYSEFVILSPFTKDGIEFTRLLFLDGYYVKRNEKYILGFDSLASINYDRGVITLIGDEMWRVQQVASRTSAKVGEAGLNILNMDAQEETSRIIIVIEDSGENIETAIKAIHKERNEIKFV